MFTRNDYLNGECSHRMYYSQFVNEETKNQVARYITGEELSKIEDQEHFNGYKSIHWWDAIPVTCPVKLSDYGESNVPSVWTCIRKEAARQLRDDYLNSQVDWLN